MSESSASMLAEASQPTSGKIGPAVMLMSELGLASLKMLLQAWPLTLIEVAPGETIPGSYWGETEAGLVGDRLYIRGDTPVHSALHEAGHFICMDHHRRAQLHTDAQGSDTEENAVCYLQCLLAGTLEGYSRAQIFADMDAWGYHFRLGSAQAWFERDSEDAVAWLRDAGLIEA